MMTSSTPLAPHLAEPTRIGDEISITGKWVPNNPGGRFRTSEESREMLKEWEDIHQGASSDGGVLSTEINHAVGEDAVIVHHVFVNPDALTRYFATTATEHMAALTAVARPDLHMVRGVTIPAAVTDVVRDATSNVAFGEHLFGFVKHDYRLPDPATAINVTAAMEQNEPGAEAVHTYVSEADNALYVRDEFADAGAVGFHLQETAAAHFPQLLAVATPGPFFFMGEVPDEMKQATEEMQLGGQFSSHLAGFDR